MRENESDASAHPLLGVSFPGKKGILTKKDGITAKKRVGGCVCAASSQQVSVEEDMLFVIPETT
jgi:hypothetical protein